MATTQCNYRISLKRVFQPMGHKIARIKADINQPHAATLPFYQGIGGQGGGQ